jgi:Bacterial Ig-like domain
MSPRRLLLVAVLAILALAGCGDNLPPPTVVDASPVDAAVIDAPAIDAAVDAAIDAVPIDAPPIDAPPIDAPPIDAPPIDAPPPTDASTVGQIQAARMTADGAGLTLPIEGVLVTYLKPALGSDPAGFTVQASATGPALFIAVDPATLAPPPVVGDEVRFTITTMATASALRQATAIAGYARISAGNNVGALAQNLTNAMDTVSGLDGYESELVDVTGTLTGSFVAAGGMFEKIQLATAGVPADVLSKVRVPSTLRDALDLVGTCQIVLDNTPMGRLNTEAQYAAFTASDLTVSNCPAPTVVSAVATSSTSVVITFSRRVQAASVNANGSQFMFDNGLTPSAAVVSGRTVTVTTSAQSVMATYTVTVLNTVRDLQGTVLGMPSTAMFPGYVVPAVVRINEFNANVTTPGACDQIELRVVSGGTLLNLRLTERVGGSGELNMTFPAVMVQANDLIVVHVASGVAACNPGTATAETTGPMQQPAAMFGANYDTAYDFWNADTGLTNTDNVFTLFGPTGTIMDVVLTANLATGTAAAASETAAASAASANQWQMVGGGTPVGGFIDDAFRAHAALDLDGTGTTVPGTSIQRLDNTDDNDKNDWNSAAITVQNQTFGALNPGQTAF